MRPISDPARQKFRQFTFTQICIEIAAITACALHASASAGVLERRHNSWVTASHTGSAQVHVLVLASQKGGTGKTTMSGHLAVEAQNAGVGPVALIDTDPQGSLSHWWNARATAEPLFVKVGPFELGEAIEHLTASGVKLAVIDTPPAITESISYVISQADLVILPTRPSPHDLRAVSATVDIANRHRKPVLFVVNAATQRARITGETAVALSQHGTVAPITLHQRVDFAASMVDGRTVGEVTGGSASAEEFKNSGSMCRGAWRG
jgi:chromosome partitioning protein